MELLNSRCGVLAFRMLPVLLVLPAEETELYCQAPALLQSLMATTRSPVCPFGPVAHNHSNDLSEMSSLSEHVRTYKESFCVLSVRFRHFAAIFKPLSWIRQQLDPSQRGGHEAQWSTHPIAPSIGTVFPRCSQDMKKRITNNYLPEES